MIAGGDENNKIGKSPPPKAIPENSGDDDAPLDFSILKEEDGEEDRYEKFSLEDEVTQPTSKSEEEALFYFQPGVLAEEGMVVGLHPVSPEDAEKLFPKSQDEYVPPSAGVIADRHQVMVNFYRTIRAWGEAKLLGRSNARILSTKGAGRTKGAMRKVTESATAAGRGSASATIESASGARVKVLPSGNRGFAVIGEIHDVASFILPILQDPFATLDSHINWSLGRVVENIRDKSVYVPGDIFGNRGYNFEPYRIIKTDMYGVIYSSLRSNFSEGAYAALVKTFLNRKERELEKQVYRITLADVVLTLKDMIRNSASPYAGRIIKMLNLSLVDNRTKVSENLEEGDSLVTDWKDVGIRLTKNGKISAVVVRFLGSVGGRELNEATFIGRPSADRKSITWEVSNTNPDIDGASSYENHIGTIKKMFRAVKHTYSDRSSTPPKNRGSGNPSAPPVANGGGEQTAGSGSPPEGITGKHAESSLAAKVDFMETAGGIHGESTQQTGTWTYFGQTAVGIGAGAGL